MWPNLDLKPGDRVEFYEIRGVTRGTVKACDGDCILVRMDKRVGGNRTLWFYQRSLKKLSALDLMAEALNGPHSTRV